MALWLGRFIMIVFFFLRWLHWNSVNGLHFHWIAVKRRIFPDEVHAKTIHQNWILITLGVPLSLNRTKKPLWSLNDLAINGNNRSLKANGFYRKQTLKTIVDKQMCLKSIWTDHSDHTRWGNIWWNKRITSIKSSHLQKKPLTQFLFPFHADLAYSE